MMTTMITHRRADVERDRDVLLELHSHANYASSSPWVRSLARSSGSTTTGSGPQVKEFLDNMAGR